MFIYYLLISSPSGSPASTRAIGVVIQLGTSTIIERSYFKTSIDKYDVCACINATKIGKINSILVSLKFFLVPFEAKGSLKGLDRNSFF